MGNTRRWSTRPGQELLGGFPFLCISFQMLHSKLFVNSDRERLSSYMKRKTAPDSQFVWREATQELNVRLSQNLSGEISGFWLKNYFKFSNLALRTIKRIILFFETDKKSTFLLAVPATVVATVLNCCFVNNLFWQSIPTNFGHRSHTS